MLLFENRIAAYLMYVRNGSAEKFCLQTKRQKMPQLSLSELTFTFEIDAVTTAMFGFV